MKTILLVFLLSTFLLSSCSKIRESAGVNRKNIDEFKVIENPPLIIPPDFNLLPPEQLSEKNIDKIEKELAEEILFGLSQEDDSENTEISTMGSILNQTNSDESDNSIRQEINEQFANEKKTKSNTWDDEVEILDSITESERLRDELLGTNSEQDKKIPTLKVKNKKNKKKKRFFFF